jgi:hypothetical protein
MKVRTGFVWIAAVLIAVVCASTAFAGYEDETWFIGAQGGYYSVPGIGSYYDESESISGANFGLQSGYSWKIVEAVGLVEHYTVSIPTGDWLAKGDDEIDTTYTEYNIGIVALEGMARFKIPVHPVVVPIFTAGMGLGIVYGDIQGKDYTQVGNQEPVRDADWEDETKPSVIPIIELTAGVRFIMHENLTFDINLGFKEGLYAGGGLIFFY